MEEISKRKEDRGRGLKNIELFGWALVVKILWKDLYGEGTWQRIVSEKIS